MTVSQALYVFHTSDCVLTYIGGLLCVSINSMDCSLPGSSIHGILQARILEWVAIFFSRRSSSPRFEPGSPALQADSLPSEPPGKTYKLSSTVLKACCPPFKRDGIGREVGGGFRMGNTCTPVADSCQCMAKPIQYCKLISLPKNK